MQATWQPLPGKIGGEMVSERLSLALPETPVRAEPSGSTIQPATFCWARSSLQEDRGGSCAGNCTGEATGPKKMENEALKLK